MLQQFFTIFISTVLFKSMESGIYKIKNIINNQIYIGSAEIIKYRWKRHCYYLFKNKHHSSKLQNAWNKYGSDSFVLEIIEFVEIENLILREQFWLDTLKPKYNISKIAGSTKGCQHTEETKQKLREMNLGSKNPLYGRRWSKVDRKNKTKHICKPKSKPIIRIDNKNGDIKLYKSITEAAKELKLSGLAGIQHVLQGRNKTCKGYIWKYKDS